MQNAQQNSPTSIGGIIDRMQLLRTERRELSARDKELKEEFDELEKRLIDTLDEQESLQGKSKTATATITESVVPNITDWDAFLKYVREFDAMHLLQRRVNSAGWNEITELDGEPPPGTEPFKKRTVSLKSA